MQRENTHRPFDGSRLILLIITSHIQIILIHHLSHRGSGKSAHSRGLPVLQPPNQPFQNPHLIRPLQPRYFPARPPNRLLLNLLHRPRHLHYPKHTRSHLPCTRRSTLFHPTIIKIRYLRHIRKSRPDETERRARTPDDSCRSGRRQIFDYSLMSEPETNQETTHDETHH